jgi:hypothetical protein
MYICKRIFDSIDTPTMCIGVPIQISALTPTMQIISEANAMNRIAFPLSIGANTFTAGVYSFRLTVQRYVYVCIYIYI